MIRQRLTGAGHGSGTRSGARQRDTGADRVAHKVWDMTVEQGKGTEQRPRLRDTANLLRDHIAKQYYIITNPPVIYQFYNVTVLHKSHISLALKHEDIYNFSKYLINSYNMNQIIIAL